MSEEQFRYVVAGGVLLAAFSFLAIAVVAVFVAWLAIKIKAKLDPILDQVNPIVGTVKQTAAELRPKITTITSQAVEVSKVVAAEAHRYSVVSKGFAEKAVDISGLVVTEAHRYSEVSKGFAEKAVDLSELVKTEAHRYADISKDVAERTHTHIAQADAAIDHAVVQMQSATGTAKAAVLRPFREIDGVFTGLGVALATLARGRKHTVRTATQDEEMFI
jgi:hypothetical protein